MAKRLDDLLDGAKKKSSDIWSNVKGAGHKKFTDTINNLNAALPTIEEAGFKLVRLDVDIALIPRLFARFRQVNLINDEKRREIFDQTKDKKLLNLMLKGLFQAVSIRKDIDIDGMDLKEIELEIGLTPSVKLIFRNEERVTLIGD